MHGIWIFIGVRLIEISSNGQSKMFLEDKVCKVSPMKGLSERVNNVSTQPFIEASVWKLWMELTRTVLPY